MGSKTSSKIQSVKRVIVGLTKVMFSAIAEITRFGVISFSRRSMFEKDILIEYGYLPWQINSTLRRFERSGYVRKTSDDKLRLLPRGQLQVARYGAEDIQAPPRPDHWDWKWRILIFDIPEEKKWARELLRNKLKEWHFAPLQRSVYISPFDCGDEFEKLLALLHLDAYVHIVLAEQISPRLERHFAGRFNLLKMIKESVNKK